MRHALFIIFTFSIALTACNNNQQARDDHSTTLPGGAQQPNPIPGGDKDQGDCKDLPKEEDLAKWLREVPSKGEAGGFASGRAEWAAVVNRSGVLCAIAVGTDDKTAAWPGAQAIAKAKAFTANAFSSDAIPMSTARLYTMSLPGHSLWSAANGNPLNPECVSTPDKQAGKGKVCGGTIVFGGGVPLYRNQTRVGGLGVSGDTPCADHEIAKRIRDAANLNPPKGPLSDDIQYSKADGASIFTHPLCPNTWRNGKKIGDEPVSSGY